MPEKIKTLEEQLAALQKELTEICNKAGNADGGFWNEMLIPFTQVVDSVLPKKEADNE